MMGPTWALELVFRESPAHTRPPRQDTRLIILPTSEGTAAGRQRNWCTMEGDRDLFGLEDDDKGEFEMTPTIQGSGKGDSTI